MVLPEASGRLINVGGWSGPALQGVRFYTPSGAPRVQGTTDWMEDYTGYSLRVPRWYPTTLPLPNGKLAVIGGQVEGGGNAGNNQPNVEVLPVEEGDGIYELQVLKDTDGANTYPNAHVLPSGNVLIVAGNKAAVHDWKNLWMPVKNMPDMTHGNRTFPYTGQSILLPLYPPDYKTEVVVCGGGTALDPMAPALSTCISIEPEAENPQWVTERMPSPRTMPDITILPDGTYLITNGAEKGHGGFNAANSPSFNAYLYDPRKPHHERFSILNTTTIARMYHSEGTLLTDGRVLISGSAPYVFSWVNLPYPTEYRMEVYHPPYLTSGLERPVITQAPREEWPIYGEKGITMMARIPSNDPLNVKVNLIIDGFVTHSTHMGQRLVGLEITVMKVLNGAENNNEFKITMIAPPNANIAPPGWYMLFVLDGPTPSEAAWVWVGGDPANFAAYPGNVSSSWVQ
ncbi:hypothetical protein HK102_000408 [Quaeritorhiza haematococci]|nr:hypothetical protein HK102_000408 [Quaeritorhiza haematococci]